MLKIRRPIGRLIFNMGMAIPGKTVFLIETAPCFLHQSPHLCWCGMCNKSDVKRLITLGCLDQYTCRGWYCEKGGKQSRDRSPKTRTLNKFVLHLLSKFGDPSLNGWWIIVRTNSKFQIGLKKDTFKWNLSLKVKVNRPLNQGIGTFGPNFVILAWTGHKLSRGYARDWYIDTQTHGRTDTQT